MTTRNRVPYRAPRDCCTAPGEIQTSLSEQNRSVAGLHSVWVRCRECGTIRRVERDT